MSDDDDPSGEDDRVISGEWDGTGVPACNTCRAPLSLSEVANPETHQCERTAEEAVRIDRVGEKFDRMCDLVDEENAETGHITSKSHGLDVVLEYDIGTPRHIIEDRAARLADSEGADEVRTRFGMYESQLVLEYHDDVFVLPESGDD
ncbi:hypothetical protein [Halomarina oriensis]|uniref:Uncharacterized protein n=1 Tax=Halomarina oriensis TaxID=671145 RepID=A0A6B0GWN4_9EURY|nr:hypothetical protein [Halomarina oriensis]MWG36555.1 hypothetical protein [Halomarina oriensis]